MIIDDKKKTDIEALSWVKTIYDLGKIRIYLSRDFSRDFFKPVVG